MDHFLLTQLCQKCKKGCETFKVSLSNYDVAGRFNLSKVEVTEQFSFVCVFCEMVNIEQVCNSNTVWYLRRQNEINKRIEQVIDELLRIKIEKLKITNK